MGGDRADVCNVVGFFEGRNRVDMQDDPGDRSARTILKASLRNASAIRTCRSMLRGSRFAIRNTRSGSDARNYSSGRADGTLTFRSGMDALWPARKRSVRKVMFAD